MYPLMHNHYDMNDFFSIYRAINGSVDKEWIRYNAIIPRIRTYLEDEFNEYQQNYIEIQKWKNRKEEFINESRSYFAIKNKNNYNVSQTWPFTFFQYLQIKYENSNKNEIQEFLEYIDCNFNRVLIDNFKINDDFECKYELPSDFEDKVRNIFFEKGNRWIRKVEIINNIFKNLRFDYYIFNPNIKNAYTKNEIDKSTDQLLLVSGKHFTVYDVYFENYRRVDFEVPRNVEHVESGENENGYWSAIKVFRIDEKIKIYMPRTENNNIILNSIY